MLYLDMSILISAVSREVATERVQHWLARQDEGFAISDWNVLEFASALAVRQRGPDVDGSDRVQALLWLGSFKAEAATLWPVRPAAFRRATDLIDVVGVKVRAADALHLAIAEERGVTLCTLDREQAEAGSDAGIPTQLL